MPNSRPPLGGLFFFLSFLLFTGLSWADEKPCPGIVIYGHKDLKLRPMEKRLICGDPKLEGYKSIPHYQARIFMTGFLQSRGYLSPVYTEKDGTFYVDPGKISKIKGIHVNTGIQAENRYVREDIRRQYRKRDLTPSNIDNVERSARSAVRRRGYPCADVKTQAIIDDQSLNLNFERMVFHPFGEIDKEKIEGLHKNALARFYPFKPGDPFDERLLMLSEKRMRVTQVVAATYFLENCSEDGKEFSMSQHFILGPPTVRFGVGANTEAGPLARLQWSNNRSGHMASQRMATAQSSFRIQTLNFSLDEYLWPAMPRRSLWTQFELTRESQFDYHQSLASLGPHMKWTDDRFGRQWTYTLGPTFEAGKFKSKSDADPNSYKNTALNGSLLWETHPYELYELHPQEGNTFRFAFDFRDPQFGFNERMLNLQTTYATLGRIGSWARGNLIGGFRYIGGTTIVPRETSLNGLPPTIKFYGGGSDDIRGFLLQTLPKNSGQGALSKLVLKFELRRTYFFRKDLEGFIFIDGGRFGETSWTLDPRIWYSPGLGLRWLSNIIFVQGYVARGLATEPSEDFENYYYVGLGGTF